MGGAKPLPRIPGPRLHHFKVGDRPLDIVFVQELGESRHACTWEVRINGNAFALKMVSDSR